MTTKQDPTSPILDLEQLLLRYAEVVTACLPPRSIRLVQSDSVEWRNMPPLQDEPEGADTDEEIEIHLTEVIDIPDGTNEERVREVFSRVSADDVTFALYFNALLGVWVFSYRPFEEMGLELRATSFDDLLLATIDHVKRRIAFAIGDVEACMEDLDRELAQMNMQSDAPSDIPWI